MSEGFGCWLFVWFVVVVVGGVCVCTRLCTIITSDKKNTNKIHKDLFPGAPADALDLLSRLLHFNPAKRLSASDALRHPYVAQFACPDDEPSCSAPVVIPINDNHKYSIAEYRDKLYQGKRVAVVGRVM